jgi:hypothetical protein
MVTLTEKRFFEVIQNGTVTVKNNTNKSLTGNKSGVELIQKEASTSSKTTKPDSSDESEANSHISEFYLNKIEL